MKLDATQAAKIAKNYFEETKTHHYFLFETIKIAYDGEEYWIVDCEVKNISRKKAENIWYISGMRMVPSLMSK